MSRTDSTGVLFGRRSAPIRRKSRIHQAAVESLESRRYFYEIGVNQTYGTDEGDAVAFTMDFQNAPQLPNYITIDSGIGFEYTAWPGIDFEWDGSIASGFSYTNDNNMTITISWNDGIDPWAQTWNPSLSNVAPTASLGNNGPVSTAGTVTVSFTSPSDVSSADTTAGFSYAFDFNGDQDFADGNEVLGSSATRTHSFGSPGAYVVRGRIYDKDSGYSEYTTTVTATATPTPPTLTLSGGTTLNEGSAGTITLGSIVDPEGDTVTNYRINWGDGTSPEVKTAAEVASASRVLTHTYTEDGSRTISVELQDADNPGTYYPAAATRTMTVSNVAPSGTGHESGTYYFDTVAGNTITLGFTGATDPGTEDAANLKFSFAASQGALAASYAAAGTNAASFSSGTVGSHLIYGKVYDNDTGISQVYHFRVFVYQDYAADGETYMTGSEPDWEGQSWDSNRNCYNYAADYLGSSSDYFAFPGRTVNPPVAGIIGGAEADGFVYIGFDPDNLAKAVEAAKGLSEDWTDYALVAAWDESNQYGLIGMHWLRLDSDGYWSDKNGGNDPVKRDDEEFDPLGEEAQIDEELWTTGYFAVKPGTYVTYYGT